MKIILFQLILLLGLHASAAETATASKFMARFTQVLNDRLEKVNNERAMNGGRLYCAQLSDEQLSDMESLFVLSPASGKNEPKKKAQYRDLSKITVGQFVAAEADQLYCYPSFWITKSRSTLGGVLFNSKSFVMDTLLIRDAIKDLAGREPEDSETLDRIFRP